jgi:DNA-binding NarL/FixJ family response regulator
VKKARILLGDDHPVFLDGSRALLETRYEVVGAAMDGRILVEAALSLKPDLILLDISMPLLSGLEGARRAKASLPRVKVLFFTMHSEQTYVQAAFEAGAAGYLLKSAASPELLTAVRKVLEGQIYVSSELSGHWGQFPDQDQLAKPHKLTFREQEVLHLVAEGRSSKQIASILNVSIKTISFHRENIKQKLGLKTIAELTRFAIAKGFV